jgi:F-type H+-transporting ATPase subunit b
MSFDWWTLLLQIVNFLILVWLLHRFLYKPVQAVIAKRRALAESALADASAKRAEAEAEKKQLDQARADLEAKRQSLIDAAQKDAEAKRKAAMEAASKQADALLAKARAEAEKAREADIASLKEELAGTAVAIAKTILTGTADHDLDAVFRARILKKLDALPAEKKTPTGAARSAGPVSVITAEPLPESEQAAWRDALKKRGFDSGPIEFSADPALVAGAELRLPHGDVRFAWTDQLKEAESLLNTPKAAE